MSSKVYKVIVIGPTGAGKSQFCNFFQRDLSNSINKVSNSMKSCTQDPFSNKFTRIDTNIELIDTAGSSDSSNNDEKNLIKLVNYLKTRKEIDFILLLLKFGERLTNQTIDYLNNLGKIFTSSEFYFHLCVIFTKYPIKPKKKDIKTRDLFVDEINEVLKDSFKIDKEQILPRIDVHFIDTEIDENDEGDLIYEEKFQDTIDIIIKKIKLNSMIYHPINTEDLDYTGDSAKKRIEEERRKYEEQIKKLEEENKRKEKEQKEIERLRKINDEREKKRLEELLRKKEDENRKKEEQIRAERELRLKFEEERKKIEEEERKKHIEKVNLDRKIKNWKELSQVGGWGFLGSLVLGGAGLLITPFCLPAGAFMIGGSIGGSSTFMIEFVGGKIGEKYCEYKKSQIK